MKNKLKNFVQWAYNHEDNQHPKYTSLSHALTVCIKNTIIYAICVLSIRYGLYQNQSHVPNNISQLQPSAPYIGIFLIAYLVTMIVSRFYESGPIALYEVIWACNQSLFIVGISCLLDDSFLIRVTLVVISVDQLLWYVDIIGYIIKRKFYVGVAKYIIWPQTSKVRLATTFHHIWFLPLCLWLIHPSSKYTTFSVQIYILSCVFCLILAILGRISTPKQVVIKDPSAQQRVMYMNINLSWQLWKDVKIKFLDQVYKMLPPKMLIVVVSLVWDLGNLPGFLLFWALELISR